MMRCRTVDGFTIIDVHLQSNQRVAYSTAMLSVFAADSDQSACLGFQRKIHNGDFNHNLVISTEFSCSGLQFNSIEIVGDVMVSIDSVAALSPRLTLCGSKDAQFSLPAGKIDFLSVCLENDAIVVGSGNTHATTLHAVCKDTSRISNMHVDAMLSGILIQNASCSLQADRDIMNLLEVRSQHAYCDIKRVSIEPACEPIIANHIPSMKRIKMC